MAKLSVDERWGKDAPFFHAHKGPGGTIFPITPWVLSSSLVTLGLSTPEQLVCRVLLDFKFSLAMAKMDLGELAAAVGRSVRQMQRIIKKLREKELVKVTPRPGRPSIIDVSPLVVAVKKLLNWQDTAQPATEETAADVAPEDEELFWLQAADSTEEAEAEQEAEEVWSDIKDALRPLVPRWAFNAHLADTEGLRWEDDILVVACKSQGQLHQMQRFKLQADLLIQERYMNALGVRFEVVKQVKRAPLLTLAVAALGV